MKKSENKTARRIVLDLDAEQFTKYETLERIVSKHCGAWSIGEMLGAWIPDARTVAEAIVEECDLERWPLVRMVRDMDAAGVFKE